MTLKCTVCGKYTHYEVRALLNKYSGLQMCVNCFEGDLLSFRVPTRQVLSWWFCAFLVWGTFEPPVHLALPLEGNLFSHAIALMFFFSLCKSSTKPLLVRVSIGCIKHEVRRLGSAFVTQQAGLMVVSGT